MKTEKEIQDKIDRLKMMIADFYLIKRKDSYYDPSIIKLARQEYEVLQWVLNKQDYVGAYELVLEREKELQDEKSKEGLNTKVKSA